MYVSPSLQRHGTLTRCVLLNTWPVNNYMKEQSVRERATDRVDRESIASWTYMPSMMHARIRKNHLVSFLFAIYFPHLYPSLCRVLSVIKTSRESISQKVSPKLLARINTKNTEDANIFVLICIYEHKINTYISKIIYWWKYTVNWYLDCIIVV